MQTVFPLGLWKISVNWLWLGEELTGAFAEMAESIYRIHSGSGSLGWDWGSEMNSACVSDVLCHLLLAQLWFPSWHGRQFHGHSHLTAPLPGQDNSPSEAALNWPGMGDGEGLNAPVSWPVSELCYSIFLFYLLLKRSMSQQQDLKTHLHSGFSPLLPASQDPAPRNPLHPHSCFRLCKWQAPFPRGL